MNVPVLTVDGPSGAGKGTVSRAVAKILGWHYLDSGSIYRSLAIAALNLGLGSGEEDAVVRAARDMKLTFDCGDDLKVKLDDTDITDQLSGETTGGMASKIAAIPSVREALLEKQRGFRKPPGLVADGRDMGTVVFPDAQFKVFLTASAEERAQRRYKQLKEKGINANLDKITQEIEERDRRDMDRDTAPLAMAADALYIDSTGMPVEAVIDEILNLIR